LRDLQHVDSLRAIMNELRAVDATKPIFVKLAPDLDPAQLDPLVGVDGISGFVATNTSLDHRSLPADRDEAGGLSGAPITAMAHTLFAALAARTDLPLVASGGIMTAGDAQARFDAGADLVQIYTGFVYHGPALIRRITKACQSR
jgi:dihydroorotate dehydrogenase